MSTERIEAVTNIQIRADATRWGLAPMRRWAAAAWGRGNRWARSLRLRLKPKFSLATGSVLVLLTLYLPTAVNSCGDPKRGYQLLLGQDDTFWPGLWTLNFQAPGRIFYGLNLALAGLTLCLVLFAVYRGEILREPHVVRCLFVIAGTISLLVLSDFSAFGLPLPLLPLAERYHQPRSDVILALPFLLVLVSFLRPQFWRVKGFFAWAFVSGALLFFLFRFDSLRLWNSDSGVSLRVPLILYVLIPVGVWYRLGLSRRKERQARWEEIRPRMQALYTLVMLFACAVLVDAVLTESHLWGLLAYFVGIHLISLGYMQLWHEANPSLAGVTH